MRAWNLGLAPLLVLGLVTVAHAGPIEPGLEGRDDIVLWVDYEEDDWDTLWTSVSHPENHEASTEEVFQGNRSLRFMVPTGEHYGGALDYTFADAGIEEPEELYFRYYVYISDTWERDSDGEIGKFPGFGGTYGVAGWGGRPSDGTDGWSARMMNWDEGGMARVGYYVYHADMEGTYGDHNPWMPDVSRNRWICIEAHAKMNTITDGQGNYDGVLEGWIDGEPAFSNTEFRFRHVDNLKIEKVWANIYVGGSWTADHDMHLYLDNMVVAYGRIGCYDESTGDTGTGGEDGGSATMGDGGSATMGDGGSATMGDGGSAGDADGGDGGTSSGQTGDDSGGCACRADSGFRAAWLLALGLMLRRRRL